ncbi:MAG: Trk system potassium transporter TrkA [Muribaculaceae bacterium]|nr:Trk system potassium transporter TrkA [Muribaculaceae bacterium]
MRIVIAGAGEVGSHLAKLLSYEEQDIIVIDENRERLDILDSSYNLMTVCGNPTSFITLKEAHAGQADLFIAVTPLETTNLVACSIAKSLGAITTVGRISHYGFMAPENRPAMQRMGVDKLIYPEYLAAREIITALEHSWVRNWFELHDGQIILVGVRIRDNAPLAGMQLKEFASATGGFHVSAIRRNHETIIPRGNDYMLAGDVLYITATRDRISDLIKLCGKVQRKIRRVLIMGGSKIAIRLVDMSGDRFKYTIVDNNRDVCVQLPEKCPDADIVHGDARDPEVLAEAGIDRCDAFIALSPSSESNILTTLSAKEAGIKKSVAEVEDIQFIQQAEALGIGSVINKKLLATSSIFQLMLDADASTSKCLALTDAEVAELEVKPGAKITKAAVKDLNLDRNMTLAALIREGRGMLVTGTTQFRAGDKVLIFCLAGSLHKVEHLFS